MKYRTIIITLLILGLGLASRADGVSEDQARQLASAFFYERLGQYQSLAPDDVSIRSAYLEKSGDIPVYYVFNMRPDGFIAISAIASAHPVLCYSFRGVYSPNGQPDNFRAWMKQYRDALAFAAVNSGAGTETHPMWALYAGRKPEHLSPFNGRDMLPMLNTTWDQGTYYNEMCPVDPLGPSGHCVTGCVATTLAQLMNYFRWPESGTGSYSYECPPYGILSADFENADYQWDQMASNLTHSNPEVAELMFHLGVSVDMVYGPNGSGMYNHKGAYTLKTYFKYAPETQYVFRDSTTMDWDSLLVTHLDQRIPLYYAGWSVPDTNGHAFIADGYQGTGYYHFNWGWSGSYDGYFYTNNLNPGGNNFNLAQELIINAVPDTSMYAYPTPCSGAQELFTLYGTIGDGSGPLYTYQNAADCSWLIAPADSVNGLSLQFHQFSLAAGDTLRIYDGDTVTAPLLAAITGDMLPEDISTSGNRLLISFQSDADNPGEGFLCEYFSDIPVYCSGTTTMNSPSDTLTDGSGTWNYHDNSLCMWRIMPPGATSITLFFLDFQTEAGADALKVYDLQTQQLLAEYSGDYGTELPGPVTASSGKMLIIFNTNSSVNSAGWTAYYESDAVGIPEPEGLQHSISPNPATDKVIITHQLAGAPGNQWILTDISGRVVMRNELPAGTSGNCEISLKNCSPGLYIYRFIPKNDAPVSGKIIIR